MGIAHISEFKKVGLPSNLCIGNSGTFCMGYQASQIWRPNLLKDISALERIQRRATKNILNDYNSNYRDRLLSLNFLPLMMQLELFDILFFIRCLKDPDTTQEFSIHSFVQFSDRNTRSSSHLKLKHSLSKSTTEAHLFFNRLPRLWNSLPPINLELSISTIKAHLHRLFWTKFQSYFDSSNPCSYHYQCPCPKCVSMSIVHSFSSSQLQDTRCTCLVLLQYILCFFNITFPILFVLIYSCIVKQK